MVRAKRGSTSPHAGRQGSGRLRRRMLRIELLELRQLLAASPLADALGAGSEQVFFLHQSVGQGIMEDHDGHPGLVSQLEELGYGFGDYSLWDSPPSGSVPTEIASLFADQNEDGHYGDLLDGIPGATDADVLMFKSCFYTLADLEDPAALARWQQAFIDSVAPYANQHPGQEIVAMPAVPERKGSGLSAEAAARGMDWSEWLAGDFIADYTTQDNVSSFNLFDFLADPESDATNANYQREEYRNSNRYDSHPNDAAYSAAADAIADYLQTLLSGGNHAPQAASQGVAGPLDTPLTIPLAATDADGDPLTYEIVASPASGTVELDGNVATYRTSTAAWQGSDQFTFRAYDGQAYSNAATVDITVYDPNPVVNAPAGSRSSSLLVRRRGDDLQVVNQRNGRLLFDQAWNWVESLTVVGADGRSDTLTVDLGAADGSVLPRGITFNGGDGTQADSLLLRGTSGADAFVLDATSAEVNGVQVQYSAAERLTLDGKSGDDIYQVSDLGTKTTLVDSKGADLLAFSSAASAVTIDFSKSGGTAQKVFAPANNNTLALKGTFENVAGTPYGDEIRGNSSANRIEGGAGNDTLYGGSGNDNLYGGEGDDWLYGEAGNDNLYGEAGNNLLLGGSGKDLLEAGAGGKSMLIGGSGSDTLRGGSGEQILIGGTTSYDNKPAALTAIMREWTADTSFDERSRTLDTGFDDDLAAGWIQLQRRTRSNRKGTVVDDGVRDLLFADTGTTWLFDSGKDLVQ